MSHHCSRRDGGKVGVEVEAVDFHSVQVAVHNEVQVSDHMGEGEDEGCGFVAAVTWDLRIGSVTMENIRLAAEDRVGHIGSHIDDIHCHCRCA